MSSSSVGILLNDVFVLKFASGGIYNDAAAAQIHKFNEKWLFSTAIAIQKYKEIHEFCRKTW